tara:strand:+ start:2247 stop:3314 length:1068 start_codon:yes stop_codon:yes gene_type:complete
MAISDSQKIDLLWKKIGFGKAKTDTNSNKKAPNEPNASSLIIKDSDIWNQSSSITSTIPSANSSVANVYLDSVSGALETTEDGASSDNRTWSTGTTNWIAPSFGATYQLKVYAASSGTANPQSNGEQLFETGSGSNDEWYFDYQSGILNFIGSNLPSAIGTSSGNVIFVAGAVYVGNTGVTSTGSSMVYRSFANLTALFAASTVETGDFVKVDDGGDGEYRLFIANQADPSTAGHLTLIGTADSAVTDAGTLTLTVTHATGTSAVIGNISSGKKVTNVTINVTTAFDGSAPTLTVGDSGDNDRLHEADDNDLAEAYAYESTPNFVYSSATDESILVYFNADSSTTGTAVVTVTYA